MMFLVSIGIASPQGGPYRCNCTPVGFAEARSIEAVAKQLGLLSFEEWNGWKKIPGVQVAQWRKMGKEFYYAPFDTKSIDKDPKIYDSSLYRMRLIRLMPISRFSSKIPKKLYEQF